MAGLAVAGAWPGLRPVVPLALACLGSLASLLLAGSRPRPWGFALALAVGGAGYAGGTLHRARLPAWDDQAPRRVRVTLRVERVYPPRRTGHCSGVGVVIRAPPDWAEVQGQRIYYALTLGAEAPERSAVIAVAGTLSAVPRHPPAETFDGYLAGLGLNFRLGRGRVLRIEQPANRYYTGLENLARRMYALLGAGLEREPAIAAVYRAMMLGRKGDLAAAQKETFLRSGTMHLFAINGLHIEVVSLSVHALLALLRCPLVPGLALVLGILWLDVSSTGNTPSATRAFLMIAGAKAGQGLRLPGNALAALAAAALAVLLLEPADFFGASFEMSYGVVLVLLTFGLPLAGALQRHFLPYRDLPEASWTRRQRWRAAAQHSLLASLGIGSAATLVGAISGVEFFGLCAPGGMAANLAVAPLAMLALVAGFAALVVGLPGWVAASRFFNGAAAVLLALIDRLVSAFSRLPGGCFLGHYRADWIGPVALALLMASCLAGYAWQWRKERGGYWPPLVVVALAMGFGVSWS